MYRGRQYINRGYLQNTCNTYCINHSILRCLMTYPAVHPFVHTPIDLSVLSIIHLLYAAVPRYVMIRNPNHEVLEIIKTIKLQPVITPTTDTWNFMVILGKGELTAKQVPTFIIQFRSMPALEPHGALAPRCHFPVTRNFADLCSFDHNRDKDKNKTYNIYKWLVLREQSMSQTAAC